MEENKNTTLLSKHCGFLLTSSIRELPHSDRRQGLVPQPSWPPCAGVFLARRKHQWRDPVQTMQLSVGGRGGIFQQPLLPTAKGIVAAGVKAVLTAPIPLARGAGCLGWRGDQGGEGREKWRSGAGIVGKRLRDHARSSMLGCHCNALGSSMLFLLGFNFNFFTF